MTPKTLTYTGTFGSNGQEYEKISLTVELAEGEKAKDAIPQLRNLVIANSIQIGRSVAVSPAPNGSAQSLTKRLASKV